MLHNLDLHADEPTSDDLATIEVEWPQTLADIDMLADPDAVDALVDSIYALEHGDTAWTWRYRRRARARITRAAVMPASRKADAA